MGKIPLTKESEFIVGEEKVLDYILSALFFALFLYGAFDAIGRRFIKIDYQSYVFILALAPAIYCFLRGQSKRIYIRVNKTGIYQDERLVTGWPNFLKAYLSQKEKKGIYNILDNFILVVEYRKDRSQEGSRRKIPLTNTQNKSEEDVLEAVQFFWKQYNNAGGMLN